MEYLIAKWLHISNATLLIGVGLGSAIYLSLAYRRGDGRLFHQLAGFVVAIDWWITAPTVLLQPVSGLWLMSLTGYSLNDAWLLISLGAFLLAAACWLPVLWIQLKMREHSVNGQLNHTVQRLFRAWVALGMVAFPLMFLIYWLMLAKPV